MKLEQVANEMIEKWKFAIQTKYGDTLPWLEFGDYASTHSAQIAKAYLIAIKSIRAFLEIEEALATPGEQCSSSTADFYEALAEIEKLGEI